MKHTILASLVAALCFGYTASAADIPSPQVALPTATKTQTDTKDQSEHRYGADYYTYSPDHSYTLSSSFDQNVRAVGHVVYVSPVSSHDATFLKASIKSFEGGAWKISSVQSTILGSGLTTIDLIRESKDAMHPSILKITSISVSKADLAQFITAGSVIFSLSEKGLTANIGKVHSLIVATSEDLERHLTASVTTSGKEIKVAKAETE